MVPSGYFARKDVMYVQLVGIQGAVSYVTFVRYFYELNAIYSGWGTDVAVRISFCLLANLLGSKSFIRS